jgi:hypothetical protein
MASNDIPDTSSSSGTLNGSSTPSKRRGKAKAARKPSSSASGRSGARLTDAPVEILFKDPPNPYVTPQPPYIWIDHPQQNERLLGPVYVIRMGVGGAEEVEISFDGGVWQPCRLTSGYWWFDWSGIRPGRHTLTARMRTTDGRWFRTPVRNCDYRP